ncbi:MAG TPA: hypothetical protein VGC95_03490, partial [Chitinophagaceae bacterium]
MKHLSRILWATAILLLATRASGQAPPSQPHNVSNLRIRKLPVLDTLTLDTLSVVPRSVIVQDVADSNFHLDFINGRLT